MPVWTRLPLATVLGVILWALPWSAPGLPFADDSACLAEGRSHGGSGDSGQGEGSAVALAFVRGSSSFAPGGSGDQEAAGWRLDVVWSVGGVDVPEEEAFGAVYGLSIGPHGQVFVLDRQAHSITVFDPEGRFLRRFGGRGEGPGEFRGPSAMTWDACGRLWVIDAFNHRYTAFDSTGRVLETLRRPFTTVHGRYQHLLVLEDSSLLDESGWPVRGHYSIAFVRIDRSGAPVDSFPPLPIRPDTGLPGPTRPEEDAASWMRLNTVLGELIPYRPHLRYALTGDTTVWFARSDRYQLVHRTLGGDTLLVLEPGHRSPTLDREDAQFIRGVLSSNRFRPTDFGFEFGRQIIQALVPLEDGRILVQIVQRPGRDSALFDLYDGTGSFLGEVRFPVPVDTRAPPAVDGDTIVFVSRGEFDEIYVHKGVLRRVGGASPGDS